MRSLKVYFYTPADVGLEKFPSGKMRLRGFDTTEIPAAADVFCLPAIMHGFSKEQLLNLKYLSGREERHVVWDCADNFRTFGVPWIAIRCATTKQILKADPTTIAWPWPVEPLAGHEALAGRPEEFEYDVSFWGWRTPLGLDLTVRACDSIKDQGKLLTKLIKLNKFFFGWKPESDPDYKLLREGFIQALHGARLSPCPRSIDGVVRYRFYEQMTLARGQPVHICDNVVMPWADHINWDYIVPKLNVDWAAVKGKNFDHAGLSLPEALVDQVGPLLVEWLAEHDDEDIRKRAQYAQEMYNTYLHRDKWDDLFGLAVRLRLEGKI